MRLEKASNWLHLFDTSCNTFDHLILVFFGAFTGTLEVLVPRARPCKEFIAGLLAIGSRIDGVNTSGAHCDVLVLVGDSLHFTLDSLGKLGSAPNAQEIILVRSVHRVLRGTASD